jgi:pimeloyl-ACP methyl ester carboxylesterase
VHGFPTSSFDFRLVLAALGAHRRVLLLDLIGYGLSAKPDVAYTMAMQADVVQSFVAETGVERLALLTHDMGDTVGGELLARQVEGRWPVEITRRVITNGSIYIEMAHLSTGQEILLSLPDERLPDVVPDDGSTMKTSLAATFSAHSRVDDAELSAAWELISHRRGHQLLPRTIRYIEERRRNQARFTGAIETHPSPLAIVWGADDPIAVVDMARKLHQARPDASLTVLDDVGHFPMVESPREFEKAVLRGLV